MLYDSTGNIVRINNLFKNQCLFLTLSGPSFSKIDTNLLNQPGIMTLGVNNSPRTFRPNLWVSVDSPSNFMISIWQDPRIMKFTHVGKQGKVLWDNTVWKSSHLTVQQCPNVFYWKDNEYFQPELFLTEETINWGNHTDRCECGFLKPGKKECEKDPTKRIKVCPQCNKKQWGSRSVMLSAVRIAHILGFRKIFLLGCDFKMELGKPNYAFQQDRSKNSVRNNNDTYTRLNLRFDRLRPIFEKDNFFIWNCCKDSGLKSFDYMDFELAIKIALKDFPDVKTERSEGMYERRANESE
jgi:hypothetical protein